MIKIHCNILKNKVPKIILRKYTEQYKTEKVSFLKKSNLGWSSYSQHDLYTEIVINMKKIKNFQVTLKDDPSNFIQTTFIKLYGAN